MKKNLFILLLFIGFTYHASAQVNEGMYKGFRKGYADSLRNENARKRDSIINNAEFIFEGKVIQKCLQFNEKGEEIGYSTVRIEKIYRGHSILKFGIVKIYRNRNSYMSIDYNIFFCKSIHKTKYKIQCNDEYLYENNLELELIDNLIAVSPQREEMVGLYDLNFSSYSKARSFIKQYSNVSIKDKSSQKKSAIEKGVNAKQKNSQ